MQLSSLLHNQWFCKATFTVCAIAVAPADPIFMVVWAFVGFGFGYQLDEWARSHRLSLGQSLDAWRLLRQAKSHNPWLIYTFAGLGHLGKVAGPIRQEHIAHARELMRQLRFDAIERERAQEWFKAGKMPGCPFPELAEHCRNLGHQEFETFALKSLQDSVELAKDEAGRRVCELACTGLLLLLGVSASRARTGAAQGGPSTSAQAQMSVPAARALLGVDSKADQAAITQAYRRLVARLHPDRLPTHADAEQRAKAEARMAEVNVAREVLTGVGETD